METVKEKLVKLFRGSNCPDGRTGSWLECNGCKYESCPDCYTERNADYLIQNGVTIQEWVSVDEPPKESGHYWVNIHQKDEEKGEECDMVLDAWYQPNNILFAPKEVGWTLMNEWHDLTGQMRQYITHWMPVPYPEPPKGVQ